MSTRAMLVVPGGALATTSDAVSALAIDGWRDKLLVHELPGPSPSSEESTESVLDAAARFGADKIFVPRGLVLEDQAVLDAGRQLKRLESASRELRRPNSDALNSVLKGISLDFCSRAVAELARWDHAEVVQEAVPSGKWALARVEKWRRQFQVVDPKLGPVLADAILRRLRVLTTQYAVNCTVQHGLPGPYGIIEDKLGKSWGVMSNVLKKGLESKGGEAEILPIHEAVTKGARDGRLVRIMEDGLFSATELLAVVESLVGARTAGDTERREKTPPLEDVSYMRTARQEWAYGCVTDYGQIMFHAMAKVYGLSSATLHVHEKTHQIAVLRPGAVEVMQARLAQIAPILELAAHEERRQKLREFRHELTKQIVPVPWSSDAVIDQKLRELCQGLGAQLWRTFLIARHGQVDSDRWPDSRIQKCGLGMEGMGLTFAFAHSIPRASLPVLWGTGKVRAADGADIDWFPLFPRA